MCILLSLVTVLAPRIMIERALSLGLTHLCLTDHMDYDYTDGDLCFEFDPKVYFEQLLPLKEEFADRIDLRIGIELGLQPYLTKKHHNLIFSYPFDFVIGSVHLGKSEKIPTIRSSSKEGRSPPHTKNILNAVSRTWNPTPISIPSVIWIIS